MSKHPNIKVKRICAGEYDVTDVNGESHGASRIEEYNYWLLDTLQDAYFDTFGQIKDYLNGITKHTTVKVCDKDYDGLEDSGFITRCGWRGPKDDDSEECDHDVILNDLRDSDKCQIHGGFVPFVEVTEDPNECDQGVECRPSS